MILNNIYIGEAKRLSEQHLKSQSNFFLTDFIVYVSERKKKREYLFLSNEIKYGQYFSDQFLNYGEDNYVEDNYTEKKNQQHFNKEDLDYYIVKLKRFFDLIKASLEFSGKTTEAEKLTKVNFKSIFYKGVEVKNNKENLNN